MTTGIDNRVFKVDLCPYILLFFKLCTTQNINNFSYSEFLSFKVEIIE